MPTVPAFFHKWGIIILAFLIMALLLVIVINFTSEHGLFGIKLPRLW
jgi:hypothetical protein